MPSVVWEFQVCLRTNGFWEESSCSVGYLELVWNTPGGRDGFSVIFAILPARASPMPLAGCVIPQFAPGCRCPAGFRFSLYLVSSPLLFPN